MKKHLLVLALALACSPALAQTIEQQENEAVVREVLTGLLHEARLELCFDRARLMIFGAKAKGDGHALQAYVDSGALPKDSIDYQLVARGYELNGIMDNEVKAYFLRCIKENH